MRDNKKHIVTEFGNKLRVRTCGICLREDEILLAKHDYLGEKNYFWSPPGGGMRFGETATEALQREFEEETGLDVEVKELLFTHEFKAPPLHAVELFFRVEIKGGSLSTGYDPELDANRQIIQQVEFVPFRKLKEWPVAAVHQIFGLCADVSDLLRLRGYFLNGKAMA